MDKEAHHVSWEMLPILWDGPVVAAENTTNGNEWARCSSRDAAEALVRAHGCCRKNLPMDKEAHHFSWEMLLILWDGPIVAAENTTNGNEWAHCSSRDAAEALVWAHGCCRKNLPAVMKRPNNSSERCHRCSGMGPYLLPKILPMAMNGPTVPPEMLPKHSYGPIVAAE
jgi:hypothetical protein